MLNGRLIELSGVIAGLNIGVKKRVFHGLP
jgi:hypothetical protein